MDGMDGMGFGAKLGGDVCRSERRGEESTAMQSGVYNIPRQVVVVVAVVAVVAVAVAKHS